MWTEIEMSLRSEPATSTASKTSSKPSRQSAAPVSQHIYRNLVPRSVGITIEGTIGKPRRQALIPSTATVVPEHVLQAISNELVTQSLAFLAEAGTSEIQWQRLLSSNIRALAAQMPNPLGVDSRAEVRELLR
ncbi:hypothetical protein HDK64DRAFT_256368 [Phyllosticta capitalensis]